MAFGSAQFLLDCAEPDGHTKRAHLLSGWKQTGIQPDELKVTEPPEGAAVVWNYYNALATRRTYGQAGPQPITWEAMHAWQSVSQLRLRPWELRAVLALDDAFIGVWFENNK